MRQIGISMKSWKRGIAALGVVAALTLASARVQAEPCGDVPNIADDLIGIYLDQFEVFFPLSNQKNCDSLQKTFLSACNSAVKDAVKCWDRQLGTLPKAAGPVCSEANKADQCNQTFKGAAKLAENAIEGQASVENADCQIKAVQLFSDCFLD